MHATVPADILWAEDNRQDQMLIEAALQESGLAPNVRFADDGMHLLAAFEKGQPDLVVLDLKMPRLGGLETLRRIRGHATRSKQRVVIFSAGDQARETAACMALGALDVVQKPVDFREFTTAVQRVVRWAK